MYIQLTNSHPDYDNQPVIINTKNIVAIYTDTILKNSPGEFTVTCLHCPPHGTWNVKESIEQVSIMLDTVIKSDYVVKNTTTIKSTVNSANNSIDFTV